MAKNKKETKKKLSEIYDRGTTESVQRFNNPNHFKNFPPDKQHDVVQKVMELDWERTQWTDFLHQQDKKSLTELQKQLSTQEGNSTAKQLALSDVFKEILRVEKQAELQQKLNDMHTALKEGVGEKNYRLLTSKTLDPSEKKARDKLLNDTKYIYIKELFTQMALAQTTINEFRQKPHREIDVFTNMHRTITDAKTVANKKYGSFHRDNVKRKVSDFEKKIGLGKFNLFEKSGLANRVGFESRTANAMEKILSLIEGEKAPTYTKR